MKRQVSYSHLLLILIILLFIASCVLLVLTNYFHHHHAMSLHAAAATSMNNKNNNYNNNNNDNTEKSPLKKNKKKNKNIIINTPRKHGLMKNTRIHDDDDDEKYLPPQVYACPVTISEHDQHHHKGLKNINKERVVLFDTDSYYYLPPSKLMNRSNNNVFIPSFVVHNNNNNNAENEMQGRSGGRNSIRFFVIGDWGGPGRKPQRRVASLMAKVAQVEDWRGTFRISNTGDDGKRPIKENDDGKKDDDDNANNDDDSTKQEENNNNNDRQLLLDMMMNHDEDGGDHEEEQDDEVNNNIHHHHHHHNRKENENENQEEDKERKKISNFLSSFPPLYARPGSKHLDFIIGAGDNIYESGASNEFDHRFKRNFENVYTDPAISKKVWFNIAGNHDVFSHGIARDISGQIRYMLQSPSKRWWMPSTYYAHEFSASSLSASSVTDPPQPLLFIAFLHTYDISGAMTQMSTTQIKWLESRLRRTRAKFRIVVGHRPIFSAGKKHGSSKYMQNLLVPLFDKYNVSAYFSGDDHQIQILKSAAGMTRYVVSGAGARLEPLIKKSGGVPETLYQRKKFGFVSVEVDDEAGIRLVVHHVDENDHDEQNRNRKKNYGVSFVHEI